MSACRGHIRNFYNGNLRAITVIRVIKLIEVIEVIEAIRIIKVMLLIMVIRLFSVAVVWVCALKSHRVSATHTILPKR